MQLDTYMRVNNIKMHEFAKILGISLRAFVNYRQGLRDWPLSLAIKVEKITNKDVSVYELTKLLKK